MGMERQGGGIGRWERSRVVSLQHPLGDKPSHDPPTGIIVAALQTVTENCCNKDESGSVGKIHCTRLCLLLPPLGFILLIIMVKDRQNIFATHHCPCEGRAAAHSDGQIHTAELTVLGLSYILYIYPECNDPINKI